MKKIALLLVTMGLATFGVISAMQEQATETHSQYPVMNEQDLSTFARLVKEANLVEFFNGVGPFTVFAPTNSAFEKCDQKKLESLKAAKNRDSLIDLINYHVILGKYLSKNMKPGTYRTVNGKSITIQETDGQLFVNGAKVIQADSSGPNGVVHKIDTVLIP